jgi:Transglutaminase-like superfamily
MSKMPEQGQISSATPNQSKLRWGLTIAKLVLRHPRTFKRVIAMGPDEPRWVRPPRAYELPEFRESMRRSTSNEKYLRPTRWCNPREPEVIALANELGAFELSDWEFADAAFWWVSTNLAPEVTPMDSMGATLRRGTGSCLHFASAWIALCRAAGIKARYKEFKSMMSEAAMAIDLTQIMDLNETERAILPDLLNMAMGHTTGEACIDGEWVIADAWPPEIWAQVGIPIPKLGESTTNVEGAWVIPETVKHIESLSFMRAITMRAQQWFLPVVVERTNIALTAMVPLGRKIIEEAGGLEAYDQKARKRMELFATDELAMHIRDAGRPEFVEFRD